MASLAASSWSTQLVLLVGDPVEDRARLVALRVEVEVARDQRHQPLGVGGVVDRERRLVAEPVDLLAQDPHAGGVERRDPHDPGPSADELLDPLAHLGGGLVGEGDRQDRAGMRVALGDQPGDPAGQHPGLARTRAGDDQQRRPGVHDGLALGVVEAFQQLVGRRSTASARLAVLGVGGDGGRGLGDREQRAHVLNSLRPAPDTTDPHARPGGRAGMVGPVEAVVRGRSGAGLGGSEAGLVAGLGPVWGRVSSPAGAGAGLSSGSNGWADCVGAGF